MANSGRLAENVLDQEVYRDFLSIGDILGKHSRQSSKFDDIATDRICRSRTFNEYGERSRYKIEEVICKGSYGVDKEMLANKGVFTNAYSSQESEQGVEQYSNELQNVDQQYQYAPVHEVYQKPNKCRVNKVKCLVSRRSDKMQFQQLDLLEYPPKRRDCCLQFMKPTKHLVSVKI
ncbi:hypothetical protein Tco_0569942 [Tanacetum coccineum]